MPSCWRRRATTARLRPSRSSPRRRSRARRWRTSKCARTASRAATKSAAAARRADGDAASAATASGPTSSTIMWHRWSRPRRRKPSRSLRLSNKHARPKRLVRRSPRHEKKPEPRREHREPQAQPVQQKRDRPHKAHQGPQERRDAGQAGEARIAGLPPAPREPAEKGRRLGFHARAARSPSGTHRAVGPDAGRRAVRDDFVVDRIRRARKRTRGAESLQARQRRGAERALSRPAQGPWHGARARKRCRRHPDRTHRAGDATDALSARRPRRRSDAHRLRYDRETAKRQSGFRPAGPGMACNSACSPRPMPGRR